MATKRILCYVAFAFLLVMLLTACAPAAAPNPVHGTQPLQLAAITLPPATVTQPAPTAAPTEAVEQIPLASPTPQVANPDYPLAEPGPYFVGNKVITYIDESRGGREVPVTVFYPALKLPDANGHIKPRDAAPDPSGAPYPLIVSSTKMTRAIAPFLVSQGFTWAGVDRIDIYMKMEQQMYEQPLDILFALDQVASNPPEGLESLVDAEHAGSIGYSFDGYNSLAMSGARLDPDFYRSQCQAPNETVAVFSQASMSSYNCRPAENWEAFAAQAGAALTASDDGLWQPLTDARIKAVIPMGAEGWWLFGERGQLPPTDQP